MRSDCRHCWHRSEERHGPICCWCGAGDEAFKVDVPEHGPFHPVLVPPTEVKVSDEFRYRLGKELHQLPVGPKE